MNIVIIDENKYQNDILTKTLQEHGHNIKQLLKYNDIIKDIHSFASVIDLVILDIDINDVDSIIKQIDEIFQCKIILLSKEDDKLSKRDEYFKKGILDYHNVTKNIKHIANDIACLLQKLTTNHSQKILIVDDSKVICYVIKHLLQTRNYNVFMAHNAKDAFKILKKENISLLILDMELPDMHGLELMDKIRSLGLIADLQILAISGSANPSIVRQALKGGASDFLRKPFMYEEFMLKIDSRIEASIDRMTIKKQKQQIEDNLKSFEVLVNATIDAMFIFENHICTDVNLEALELLGYKKKEQLRGKNIKEIFKDIIVENQNALLDDTTDYDFEDIMISKDQKQYNVQIKEKNVKMSNKNLKIVAVMDITKIKQNEKILSHQAKMASMGEMIGNIAHQWRQPLTAISVAAGGIKLNYEFDIATKEETLKELDNIVENTQFLSSTIESFQNFLKEDKIVENFSIEPTVKKTLAIISANLVSNNITIIKNYKQQIKVNGIQNELVQVFLNIINNATDILKTFKDKDIEKYIIIDVDKLDDEKGIISIQDSAGGIPDNIINKIFEPYFTTKHQSQGTGLGLYMTHQIVTKMGGTITVSNQKFKYNNKEFVGAKFDIVLKLAK